MDKILFKIFINEKLNLDKSVQIGINNVKFLVDKSIVKLFGELIARKTAYSLSQKGSENTYEIAFYKKTRNQILTALVMASDLEYNIRIKIITN